jgi:hypothetical protein
LRIRFTRGRRMDDPAQCAEWLLVRAGLAER